MLLYGYLQLVTLYVFRHFTSFIAIWYRFKSVNCFGLVQVLPEKQTFPCDQLKVSVSHCLWFGVFCHQSIEN